MGFDKKNSIGFVDVASGKVRIMILSYDKYGKFSLIGKGESDTCGYKSGRVLNFSAFSDSVNKALEVAEKEAGGNISDVVISLSDFEYKSYLFSSEYELPFAREINSKDIYKCSSTLPIQKNIDLEKEVLIHIIPVEFIIDDEKVVDNPDGVFAGKLKINYHIITVDAQMYSDLVNVFKTLNLNVKKAVANSYASSLSVLIDDDKDVGSLVLDIGKSNMYASIFRNDKLCYNCSFMLGGDAISNYLSKKMNVRFDEAERLKIKYGAKSSTALDFSDYIKVFMIGKNGENDECEILKSDFLNISNSFTKLIFSVLKKNLSNKKVLPFVNRIVITGGGAKLFGLKNIVEEIFDCPVRIARPVRQEELKDNFDDESYATLLGLFLFYKFKSVNDYNIISSDEEHKNLFNKFIKFWNENFG